MRMNKVARHQDRSLEFSLVYGLAFVAFLVTIAVTRLVSFRGRGSQGKSLIASARAAASNSIPFAFM
jgi:hypothetical protein